MEMLFGSLPGGGKKTYKKTLDRESQSLDRYSNQATPATLACIVMTSEEGLCYFGLVIASRNW